MPTIIDTHTHLSQTREMLIDDLKRRAYYGVERGAEPRPGHDGRVVPGPSRRGREDSRRGALLHRGARHHGSRAGTHDGAALGDDGRRGAQGRTGGGRQEGRHRQVLGRRPDGHGQEADAGALYRDHRRSAQERPADHLAHLHARGCEGHAPRRPRRVRARRPRQGSRRRVHGAREAASESRARTEHARSRRPRRISTGCARAFPAADCRSSKRPTPTRPTRTRSGRSRRATWRR